TMCEFALMQTTAACALTPDSEQYRVALGAAQYRLGKFQKEFFPKALGTLNTCDSDDPVAIALRAMTQFRLNEKDQARESLTIMRQKLKEKRESLGTDADALFLEAEQLISSP